MFRATLLLIPILAGMLVLIAVMFVSLSRQGDERRRMIAEKASAGTLTMYAAYLALCTGLNFYRGAAQGQPMQLLDPLVVLTTLAVLYLGNLLYFKWRHGG